MATDIWNRIFIFSREHYNRKIKIEGKNAKFGTVIVKGSKKTYTDIVRKLDNLPSDAEVLIVGDIRNIKYNPPIGEEE